MHETPDATIVALARRHHGLVTTTQLLSAGFGHNAITLRVAKGWLRRLHRGVYLVGALESDLTRPAAALLATGTDAAISHRTAAVLWDLLAPRPGDPIHITLLNANRRSRHGIEIHHARTLETRWHKGLTLTSPDQTLEQLTGPDYEHAHNEALIRRLVPREAGATMTRSEAERRLLALIAKAGLPRPHTNVKVHGHEVDLYWPEHRLVVEFDGWAYHSTRAAFERDRLRDADLQLAGERVLRVTHRQLTGAPERLIARFAVALAGGPSNIRPVGGPLVN